MAAPRRRMSASERREQLLDSCAAIVDSEGFHAVTIERVASECGVTRTVVYQQFGGLDGMLDALVERATERAGAAVAAAADDDQPTLKRAMLSVLAAVDSDPATWRMFLVAPQIGPPALAENLERGRAAIRKINMAAIAQGGASAEDPELTARMVQVVADELVRLRLADPTVYTTERILAQIDALTKALVGLRGVDPGRR